MNSNTYVAGEDATVLPLEVPVVCMLVFWLLMIDQ